MKTQKNLQAIHLIYAFLFLVSLVFRTVNLNSTPVTNKEAQQALCALEINRQGCENISPFYLFFTRVLFTLFGKSNFFARFVPALLGSTVVLIPLMLGSKLDKKRGIILALCLALDPILIQTSRTAGDTMLGLVFTLFLFVFLLRKMWPAAVVTFAFGLLSGKSFWIGLFIFVVAYSLIWLLMPKDHREELLPKNKLDFSGRKIRVTFLISFLVWVLVGTCFFMNVRGVLSPIRTCLALFQEDPLVNANDVLPTVMRFTVFIFYSFYAIVLALTTLFMMIKERQKAIPFSLIWLLIGTIIFLIPHFAFYEAVWATVPLWILASQSLLKIGDSIWKKRKELFVPFLIGVSILVFCFLEILRFHYLLSLEMPLKSNLMLIITPLFLCLLFIFIYSYGWQRKDVSHLLSALFLLCAAFSLVRNANRSADITGTYEYELLREEPYLRNADILSMEIENYMNRKALQAKDVTIAIATKIPIESLEWSLRDYSINVVPVISKESKDNFDIIIFEADDLHSFSGYRSERLVLFSDVSWVQKGFAGSLSNEILGWLLYRSASLDFTNYMVWFKV